MNIKYILLSTLFFIFSQILIWYQLNSQLVWKWAEGYKSMVWMSLLGIPIERMSFQLLLALRFIPLLQEEFQNLLRSIINRSVNFKKRVNK